MFPCKVQSLLMAPQGDVGISQTPAGSSFSHPAEQETVKPQKCWAKPSRAFWRALPARLLALLPPPQRFCTGKQRVLDILNSSYTELSKSWG